MDYVFYSPFQTADGAVHAVQLIDATSFIKIKIIEIKIRQLDSMKFISFSILAAWS